jgi:hypothetical protein
MINLRDLLDSLTNLVGPTADKVKYYPIEEGLYLFTDEGIIFLIKKRKTNYSTWVVATQSILLAPQWPTWEWQKPKYARIDHRYYRYHEYVRGKGKKIEIMDLPLYIGWRTGKTFARLIKGDSI